jgi:hypothetical protein
MGDKKTGRKWVIIVLLLLIVLLVGLYFLAREDSDIIKDFQKTYEEQQGEEVERSFDGTVTKGEEVKMTFV